MRRPPVQQQRVPQQVPAVLRTGSAGMQAAAGTGGAAAGQAVAGAGGEPVAGSGGAGGGGEPGLVTNCGSADNVDQPMGPGPFTTTIIKNGGAGTSWVFYPMEIGRDGCKHPIFNWGPGAGTGPAEYTDHLNHLASHGFVIISQPSSGNGTTEKASLEWLIEQNDTMGSPFFQKLDTKKVVMGGHSMGALTTFAMADFAPLTHYILVCGGSFGAPTGADKIHGPTIILGGDTDSGTPNFEDDYAAIPTPVVFLIKSGTNHVAVREKQSRAVDGIHALAALRRDQVEGRLLHGRQVLQGALGFLREQGLVTAL